MANIYEQIKNNSRASWIMLGLFMLIFLALGAGLDYHYGAGARMPLFTVITFLIALAMSWSGYRYGDRLVLSSTRARELDLSDPKQKQWANILEEVSIAGGLPLPKAYIIDDPDPNAFATGRDPAHASIAVTRGLLDALSRDELQGVAAHEMSHIRNFDIRLMLLVAVLVGSIALLADWTGRMLFLRGRRRSENSKSGPAALIFLVIWLVAVILAPILSRMMAMCVSRRRESLADASAAELTRNPLALAAALEKIDSRVEPTRSINQGTAHLCIADPTGSALNAKQGRWANLFATHPPIEQRIAALRQMAYAR